MENPQSKKRARKKGGTRYERMRMNYFDDATVTFHEKISHELPMRREFYKIGPNIGRGKT